MALIVRTAMACIALMIAAPASTATPREILIDAAFHARTKEDALAQVGRAEAGATAALAKAPRDREAMMIRAMALGYRAKLIRNRGDAMAAREAFYALASANPRDPEAQAAIGAWHLDSVAALGGFLAGPLLGASKVDGVAAMDRAIALGGDRAMFSGLGALLRLSVNPRDPRAGALAEAAAHGTTPEPLDAVMKDSAVSILGYLKAGNAAATQKRAKELLPFGRLRK
jgi:hypothetical protein